MRDINSTFTQEKNAETNKPIQLFTLYDYDGGSTNLYLTPAREDVVFDAITYTSFPIQYDQISEQAQGQIDTVEITVSNVSRFFQYYLELYDLREKKINIKHVWSDQLADTDAYVEDNYYIDNYQANEKVVIFTCTSKLDILMKKIPGRLYNRNACGFTFKDAGCKYSGVETTCAKTKQACKAYNNFINFGAEPSVPTQKIYAL